MLPMTKAYMTMMTTTMVILNTISIGFNLDVLGSQFYFPQQMEEWDTPWKWHPLSCRVVLTLFTHWQVGATGYFWTIRDKMTNCATWYYCLGLVVFWWQLWFMVSQLCTRWRYLLWPWKPWTWQKQLRLWWYCLTF